MKLFSDGLKTQKVERIILNLKRDSNKTLDLILDNLYSTKKIDELFSNSELFLSPLRQIKKYLGGV